MPQRRWNGTTLEEIQFKASKTTLNGICISFEGSSPSCPLSVGRAAISLIHHASGSPLMYDKCGRHGTEWGVLLCWQGRGMGLRAPAVCSAAAAACVLLDCTAASLSQNLSSSSSSSHSDSITYLYHCQMLSIYCPARSLDAHPLPEFTSPQAPICPVLHPPTGICFRRGRRVPWVRFGDMI